ncbi:MAG: exodeoxyribonuclease VII small subunit [Gemmatimonadales bacterium]|nr:MAG: exodeoxyribonuclease VII small subunit [Gemmatimonadales bacterium]
MSGTERSESGIEASSESPNGQEAPSLEDRLRRLDEIVVRLEGGDVKLEDGLELFEEGVRHIREAETLLSRAEMRVEELIGESGELKTRPFEEGEG